jgi:DNA-directed RNA polymerase specialized sigma24 family protein
MSKRKFTDEQEQEICRRYLAGETTGQIGKTLGSNDSAIGRILKRQGVTARTPKESLGRLTDSQEAEVCARYQAGESTGQLSKAFGVAPSTIWITLKRNGITTRSNKEAQGGLTDGQESEVCARYQAGQNIPQLSKAFGVAPSTISNILKRNGVTTRSIREAMAGLDDEQRAHTLVAA